MLNLIGEGLAKGTKKALQETAEGVVKNSADYLADVGAKLATRREAEKLSGNSLGELLAMAGKKYAKDTDSVRNAVIDALEDKAVSAPVRMEIFNRTPVAARVWNNPEKVNSMPRFSTYRSNAVQAGEDLGQIIWQYSNELGDKSAITLSDLDSAFVDGMPVYSGTGDLFSPYGDEGVGAFRRWANEHNISPSTRQRMRDRYWSPITENIDTPKYRMANEMQDYSKRGVGNSYDEYLAMARPNEAIPETRMDYIARDDQEGDDFDPSDDLWSFTADDYAANYRDKLLDLFLRNKGIASKAIPGLALLLGATAFGNNKTKEG
jgi:hypothetical protein